MRLNGDGTRDTTFNPGGVGASSTVSAIAVQSDGKILVGGSFFAYNGQPAVFFVRLNTDGTRDATFNPGGTGPNGTLSAIAVQPDDKIIIAGAFGQYSANAAASDNVMRLNADGTRDTTFNAGGTGASSTVFALALQSDGKLVIAGFFTAYNDEEEATSNRVIRLNADGTRDASFNPGGAGANNILLAVALQADGKILLGGILQRIQQRRDGARPRHTTQRRRVARPYV